MSADFWAGYISGAAGILIGNPLDLIKVRLQATPPISPSFSTPSPPSAPGSTPAAVQRVNPYTSFTTASSLIRGASAPILGYGALNALLFVTYNRTSSFLTHYQSSSTTSAIPGLDIEGATAVQPNLTTTFIAGALGGLATWIISTPTELIKCRAQLSSSISRSPPLSSPSNPTTSAATAAATSYTITRAILRTEGVRGLYFGGVVTALRDSIGYGFYFWSYELCSRFLVSSRTQTYGSGLPEGKGDVQEAMKVLLCGGIAGVVTWASIFPLDVIKTRVQTQTSFLAAAERAPLLSLPSGSRSASPGGRSNRNAEMEGTRRGAIEIAKNAYRNEGVGVFFRGLGVCSVRAFVVNAVQWAVYEWIMRKLDPTRRSAVQI